MESKASSGRNLVNFQWARGILICAHVNVSVLKKSIKFPQNVILSEITVELIRQCSFVCSYERVDLSYYMCYRYQIWHQGFYMPYAATDTLTVNK